MSNPNPPPPPVAHRFSSEKQPATAGGRTPTKWLRDRLNKAAKSGDKTERERVFDHILEIATQWEVVVVGRDSEGELLKVASGRDAVAAAKLLFEYDMGKPTASVEVSNPDGTLGGVAHKTTAELREAVARAFGLKIQPQTPPKDESENAEPAGQPGPGEPK